MTRLIRPAWLFGALLAACAVAQAEDTGDAPVIPLASSANAAPPPPAAPADTNADSDEPAQLEEVIVTAQKRKESLQDVPISVTAVDGHFIQDVGVADLAKVAEYVPNARVDAHDPGSPQLFIRGFGTNAFNPSFESSVAFVQDEIYYGRPGYFTESMFDVDHVEVLRGPQGTLFGKNTIAGIFNVTTKSPTDVFEADGRYQFSQYDSRRLEAGAGGMLTDWLGLRVSGFYRDEGGELYNTYLDRSEEALTQKAARAKIKLLLGDSVTSDVQYQASNTHAPFWPFQLYKLDSDTRTYLDAFDPNVEDNPKDFRTEFNTPGWIHKGSETVSARTLWSMGDLGGLSDAQTVLVLAGSQFHIDQINELDVSPADISFLDSHEHHQQLSGELRFSADSDSLFGLGDKVEFVTGVFDYYSHYVLRASINAGKDLGSYLATKDFCELAGVCTGDEPVNSLPPVPLLGTITSPVIQPDYFLFNYDQKVNSLAGFGQATWHVTEHWAITPGVRINQEDKNVHSMGTQHCPTHGDTDCVIALLLSANNYDEEHLKRRETDVSPKIVLQYFSGGGLNLYTSYARGYKSGGYNSLSYVGGDLTFKPEKAQTYELGTKTTLFDNTLRWNATLYWTRFEDLQVLSQQGIVTNVSNAAAATSKGLESDFMWITPYEPLRIMGSVGVIDAHYDRYPGAPAPVRNPQTGELQIGATQDLAGGRIAYAPKQTATLTPTLTMPLSGAYSSELAADMIFQGNQYTDVSLDPNTYVPSYVLYNARASVSNTNQGWTLSMGGTNITDKRVLNQVQDAAFFPGTYYAQQAAGRQLFVAVNASF